MQLRRENKVKITDAFINIPDISDSYVCIQTFTIKSFTKFGKILGNVELNINCENVNAE